MRLRVQRASWRTAGGVAKTCLHLSAMLVAMLVFVAMSMVVTMTMTMCVTTMAVIRCRRAPRQRATLSETAIRAIGWDTLHIDVCGEVHQLRDFAVQDVKSTIHLQW